MDNWTSGLDKCDGERGWQEPRSAPRPSQLPRAQCLAAMPCHATASRAGALSFAMKASPVVTASTCPGAAWSPDGTSILSASVAGPPMGRQLHHARDPLRWPCGRGHGHRCRGRQLGPVRRCGELPSDETDPSCVDLGNVVAVRAARTRPISSGRHPVLPVPPRPAAPHSHTGRVRPLPSALAGRVNAIIRTFVTRAAPVSALVFGATASLAGTGGPSPRPQQRALRR